MTKYIKKMWINLPYFQTTGLTWNDVYLLQMIKQKEIGDEFFRLNWKITLERYVEQMKNGKPKLTEKGKEFLIKLEEAPVEEQDEKIFVWLSKFYESEDKKIGNAKKTKIYIKEFRIQSGIEKNNLAFLCQTFIQDEKNMEYNKVLEYMFYKPPNAFSVKFKLEESRLYQYYLSKEEYFKQQFQL